MNENKKISAFMIAHNEEDVIERALKSIYNSVDELMVIHDGPCKDRTLEIAKKYTRKIFVRPRKGRASLHMVFAFKKAENDWLFKLDADEFLSEKLKENLHTLASNENASAYTFLWPLWNGKRYVTKNWPHKKSMFRKSKVSFLQFPGWDEPDTTGSTIKTDYILEHKPSYGKNEAFLPWKDLWARSIKRGRDHTVYTLKDFDEIEKFQYNSDDFPLAIKVRRKFPLLSAPFFAFASFWKGLFSEGAWKEGRIVFKGALETSLYYLWLGYEIYRVKNGNRT